MECGIDVYSLYFTKKGKCLEQLMTFIFAFSCLSEEKKMPPFNTEYLYFGNSALIPVHPTFWMWLCEWTTVDGA